MFAGDTRRGSVAALRLLRSHRARRHQLHAQLSFYRSETRRPLSSGVGDFVSLLLFDEVVLFFDGIV